MTVTIEVINKGSLELLRSMESMGLIHVIPPVSHDAKNTGQVEKECSFRKFQGIHKDLLPKGSVENFLAECRADKEREFAIEKREREERSRYA